MKEWCFTANLLNDSFAFAKTILGMMVMRFTSKISFQSSIDKSKSEAASSDPFNDTVLIPGQEYLNIYFHNELSQLYHNYISSLQILCRRVVRLGSLADGGWDMCGDFKYKPRSNCLVYSFGIKDDFSFDDDCSTRYKCEVHSFDPSTGKTDHMHSKNVYFHNVGLSNKNNMIKVKGVNWRMRTLKTILVENGHAQETIDILKIDIEEWEWEVVPEMIQSGVLRNVRQLLIELHIVNIKTKEEPTKEKYISSLVSLKQLYDLGFRIFWTHRNLCCKFTTRNSKQQRTGCQDVAFVNTQFLTS